MVRKICIDIIIIIAFVLFLLSFLSLVVLIEYLHIIEMNDGSLSTLVESSSIVYNFWNISSIITTFIVCVFIFGFGCELLALALSYYEENRNVSVDVV
ncbi:MAG: hypothetical protein KAS12_04535 [Candidatus Aenigmarchaeota archaeon]|nr:hypothetical protein [Candidatus Aenigmarchaeota archaeon]